MLLRTSSLPPTSDGDWAPRSCPRQEVNEQRASQCSVRETPGPQQAADPPNKRLLALRAARLHQRSLAGSCCCCCCRCCRMGQVPVQRWEAGQEPRSHLHARARSKGGQRATSAQHAVALCSLVCVTGSMQMWPQNVCVCGGGGGRSARPTRLLPRGNLQPRCGPWCRAQGVRTCTCMARAATHTEKAHGNMNTVKQGSK